MDPLVFEPYFRPQVWGGRRFESFLGKPLPSAEPFGEVWVLSGQSLHVSRVADGALQGALLTDLWTQRGSELLGRPTSGPFPLLLKYLDCQELLSIQVHPNDELAARLRPGELGKTEAWIVLDAAPTARIYAGLKPGVGPDELARRLDDGALAECLHSIAPRKGQCIFLSAGSVHAVGGGVLIAEVQQSSDATFRLFDWNRLGPDGKPRQLHRDEALQAIDWSRGPVEPAMGAVIEGCGRGNRCERLVDCPMFSIDRFDLTASMPSPYAGQLSLWMVLEGAVTLWAEGTGYRRRLTPGDAVLVPASAPSLVWQFDASPAVILGVQARG